MNFLEKYETADRTPYEELARKYLVDYLLVDGLKGDEKRMSLTSSPVEGMMPCAFVPSMFYTFLYLHKTAADDTKYDAVPLVLCTGFDGKKVTGINFNIIPNNSRASILDRLMEGYIDFYNNANPSNPINNDLGKHLINPAAFKAIVNILSRDTGLNINSAIRTYDMRFIRKPRLVEYDMWEYIPFLSFKDAVRGGALASMQISMVNENRR